MKVSNEVATRLIAEKVKEIKMIYEACYPKANYLSMSIVNGSIQFWNDSEEDKDYRINYYENLNKGEEHE